MADSCTVLVENLPADASREDLSTYFAFHGHVEKVLLDGTTALITFESGASARSALLFDGAEFHGSAIAVALDAACVDPIRRTLADGSGSPSGGSGGGSSSPDECRVSQDSDVAAQTAAAAAAAADADATAAAVAAAAAAAATAAAAAAAAKAPVTSPKWACRTAAAAGVSAGIDGTVRRAIDGFADAVAEVPLNEGRALLGSTLAMMALLAVV
ncbi:hypothetical protein EMIHUDRAFT_455251 [Emiliania huxleyi CCMP1516]|uniref:RRM domain-containing protein n=4 Tax=Emiliania huxleyi TaxID=2903 RepID=A0A0D3HYD2_EMIH1|nr:hypothetical protein EMIHUDRAFT_460277 [Emiliania huxleyi CCMP1516]XP_005788299.1 hypothetical protein EMIHUDRAFT_455251 [Emiliania huxleyi CCMP1516]EOD04017.1 hypothetical protein EMIHUDRAFT_460277 [Emiliania huxleyi CCMP1516]EOD35870.1 hypothetical protein EMIHUDRAFT_455251 [Emiliania huxleyi CCMP1516]|eukprot:XP_005756446.1 hypothetical protein EMIHUDRAFT_460277 [Emiliania huxleyi CCMP1516]